uniref:Uncharacterized protein n=1 Tax=Euplotes harpa TaxID=151035 RepID=A0A7S3JE35_9SPIT|mmetsp:Transcript_3073/g.3755  ORF Transcript_3073/g.3755 Transcript_3073/m.3755 type:complete len:170 (+) Transcript_3073:100-609(+)
MSMCVVFKAIQAKIATEVKIDSFTRFYLDKISQRTDLTSQNDTLKLQVGNVKTTNGNGIQSEAAYYKVNGYLVQQLSAVVSFSGGGVTSFKWNHGCVDCSSSECLTDPLGNQNCFYVTCPNCDPNIFITWSGDDGKGNFMISNSFSFKQFADYMISSYYQNALKSDSTS